jgi:predicted metal-dependent phosphoesterase TrpH
MKISVDFHCHTAASKDSCTKPEKLIESARKNGLDRIVITDHNSIQGALKAFSLAPDLVIVGEEIKTTKGELLAAYLKKEIPGGLEPFKTIQILRDQGAFISISHPFDWRTGAWEYSELMEIIHEVDALEVFNSRCMKKDANKLAMDFANQFHLAGTAGSDAHVAFEIGNGYVEVQTFSNAEELKHVIKSGKIMGRMASFWVHIFSRFARINKYIWKSRSV